MRNSNQVIKADDEVLKFDLTDKLKVMGVPAEISAEDNKYLGMALKDLIVESDFVACQSDFHLWLYPRPFAKSFKYNASFQDYQCSILDFLYAMRLKPLIAQFTPTAISGLNDLAAQASIDEGKPFYSVDFHPFDFFKWVSQKDNYTKIKNIFALSLFETFEMLDDINFLTEKSMLEKIADKEGPVDGLQRKGLLIVNRAHANNYRELGLGPYLTMRPAAD